MADVYYPVVSEGKLKFLLYIAIDTSPYFQSLRIAEELLKNILSVHMDSSRSVTIGSLALSLSLLVIMWLLLKRGFRVMNKLVENSKKVASGDLTVKKMGTKGKHGRNKSGCRQAQRDGGDASLIHQPFQDRVASPLIWILLPDHQPCIIIENNEGMK